MFPIKEIFKIIGLPIWIGWSSSLASIIFFSIAAILAKNDAAKVALITVVITAAIPLFLVSGIIFYSANDSLKKLRVSEEERRIWKKELTAMKTSRDEKQEKGIRGLDWRLQSIEGIIGYLDQSIKMEYEPKQLVPIMLFLAKEIQSIREGK